MVEGRDRGGPWIGDEEQSRTDWRLRSGKERGRRRLAASWREEKPASGSLKQAPMERASQPTHPNNMPYSQLGNVQQQGAGELRRGGTIQRHGGSEGGCMQAGGQCQ